MDRATVFIDIFIPFTILGTVLNPITNISSIFESLVYHAQ